MKILLSYVVWKSGEIPKDESLTYRKREAEAIIIQLVVDRYEVLKGNISNVLCLTDI